MSERRRFDRLTAVDASFLHQEGPTSHMHIGALTIFDGEPPPLDDLLDVIRGRLHLVPRYRQRLAEPPLQTGRPVWVDDPDFRLDYHVRSTALPRPGTEEQLRRLTARVFSQQLDRSKPLWEIWLVEGLQDGRFGVVSKTHHSVIDGISGVDIGAVLFDLAPEGTEVPHPDEAWEARPEPTPAELLAGGTLGLARQGVKAATRAVEALGRPRTAIDKLKEAAEGVGEIAWSGLNPAPATPLNVAIGPHRRYETVSTQLADFRTVKAAFGGTVNDVVLTVVSGALRRWLRGRGVRVEGLELRALVPVSVRAQDERGSLGNKIVLMRGPLPVYVGDPVQRLQIVRGAMQDLKAGKQALGAEVIAGAQGFAPPTLLAQASRLQFSTRLFNLIVTNVPGPQFPLYLAGARLQRLYPVAFLPRGHAMAIAIMSYDGGLDFGLLGDYEQMHDLGTVADGIRASLDDLLARAATAAALPA